MPIDTDRVRRHTAPSVLSQIDDESVSQLMKAIDQPETLAPRLSQLDAQWDLDRTLETEAALMGLLGLALGVFVKRQLLVIPAAVGASVLVFAAVGAYPLLPLIERTLQLNASILVLVGLSLGTWVDKRFFFLPAMVFSFFAQHALQGWCPPIPLFRRLGIRT